MPHPCVNFLTWIGFAYFCVDFLTFGCRFFHLWMLIPPSHVDFTTRGLWKLRDTLSCKTVVVDWLSVKETVAEELDKQLRIEENTRLFLTTWNIATNWTYDSSLQSFIDCRGVKQWKCGGGGGGGGGKTIEMWWWWWRENNRNVVVVVVEGKQ